MLHERHVSAHLPESAQLLAAAGTWLQEQCLNNMATFLQRLFCCFKVNETAFNKREELSCDQRDPKLAAALPDNAPVHAYFSLMMQHTTDPVALFSQAGTLLVSNPASEELFDHMRRVITGATGLGSRTAPTASLQLLFSSDPDALQEALMVVEHGRTWRGVLLVPQAAQTSYSPTAPGTFRAACSLRHGQCNRGSLCKTAHGADCSVFDATECGSRHLLPATQCGATPHLQQTSCSSSSRYGEAIVGSLDVAVAMGMSGGGGGGGGGGSAGGRVSSFCPAERRSELLIDVLTGHLHGRDPSASSAVAGRQSAACSSPPSSPQPFENNTATSNTLVERPGHGGDMKPCSCDSCPCEAQRILPNGITNGSDHIFPYQSPEVSSTSPVQSIYRSPPQLNSPPVGNPGAGDGSKLPSVSSLGADISAQALGWQAAVVAEAEGYSTGTLRPFVEELSPGTSRRTPTRTSVSPSSPEMRNSLDVAYSSLPANQLIRSSTQLGVTATSISCRSTGGVGVVVGMDVGSTNVKLSIPDSMTLSSPSPPPHEALKQLQIPSQLLSPPTLTAASIRQHLQQCHSLQTGTPMAEGHGGCLCDDYRASGGCAAATSGRHAHTNGPVEKRSPNSISLSRMAPCRTSGNSPPISSTTAQPDCSQHKHFESSHHHKLSTVVPQHPRQQPMPQQQSALRLQLRRTFHAASSSSLWTRAHSGRYSSWCGGYGESSTSPLQVSASAGSEAATGSGYSGVNAPHNHQPGHLPPTGFSCSTAFSGTSPAELEVPTALAGRSRVSASNMTSRRSRSDEKVLLMQRGPLPAAAARGFELITDPPIAEVDGEGEIQDGEEEEEASGTWPLQPWTKAEAFAGRPAALLRAPPARFKAQILPEDYIPAAETTSTGDDGRGGDGGSCPLPRLPDSLPARRSSPGGRREPSTQDQGSGCSRLACRTSRTNGAQLATCSSLLSAALAGTGTATRSRLDCSSNDVSEARLMGYKSNATGNYHQTTTTTAVAVAAVASQLGAPGAAHAAVSASLPDCTSITTVNSGKGAGGAGGGDGDGNVPFTPPSGSDGAADLSPLPWLYHSSSNGRPVSLSVLTTTTAPSTVHAPLQVLQCPLLSRIPFGSLATADSSSCSASSHACDSMFLFQSQQEQLWQGLSTSTWGTMVGRRGREHVSCAGANGGSVGGAAQRKCTYYEGRSVHGGTAFLGGGGGRGPRPSMEMHLSAAGTSTEEADASRESCGAGVYFPMRRAATRPGAAATPSALLMKAASSNGPPRTSHISAVTASGGGSTCPAASLVNSVLGGSGHFLAQHGAHGGGGRGSDRVPACSDGQFFVLGLHCRHRASFSLPPLFGLDPSSCLSTFPEDDRTTLTPLGKPPQECQFVPRRSDAHAEASAAAACGASGDDSGLWLRSPVTRRSVANNCQSPINRIVHGPNDAVLLSEDDPRGLSSCTKALPGNASPTIGVAGLAIPRIVQLTMRSMAKAAGATSAMSVGSGDGGDVLSCRYGAPGSPLDGSNHGLTDASLHAGLVVPMYSNAAACEHLNPAASTTSGQPSMMALNCSAAEQSRNAAAGTWSCGRVMPATSPWTCGNTAGALGSRAYASTVSVLPEMSLNDCGALSVDGGGSITDAAMAESATSIGCQHQCCTDVSQRAGSYCGFNSFPGLGSQNWTSVTERAGGNCEGGGDGGGDGARRCFLTHGEDFHPCAPQSSTLTSTVEGMETGGGEVVGRGAVSENVAAVVQSGSCAGGEVVHVDDGRWFEVVVSGLPHPATGEILLLVVQHDISSRVWAEKHLARVMEAEHLLLESIFPQHVLEHIAVMAATTALPGERATSFPVALPGGITQPPALLQGAAQGPPGAAVNYIHNSVRGGGSPMGGQAPPITGDTFLHLATSHSALTVLFCDIQGFTTMCNTVKPVVVMAFLNDLYTRLDALLDTFGVYKVETIGDCYVAAGGLMKVDEETGAVTVRSEDVDPLHAHRTVQFAKAILQAAAAVRLPTTGEPVRLRVGIHSGPAMSGVVGTRMPRFCLFGDTINTASRMESTGVPGAIHVSQATRYLTPQEPWEPTGGVEAKGKGRMLTYLLKS